MKCLTNEAQTMLAHLPIYLEAKFGPAIWKWFTTSHKADLKDCTWDKQLQKITTDDDQQEGVDFLRGLHGKKLTPWETVDDSDFNMDNDQEITFELDKSFAFIKLLTPLTNKTIPESATILNIPARTLTALAASASA